MCHQCLIWCTGMQHCSAAECKAATALLETAMKMDNSEKSEFFSIRSFPFKVCYSTCSCYGNPSLIIRELWTYHGKQRGGTACVPSERATPYSYDQLRQVLADNWAPCRLKPQRCCLLELITITQKLPLKTSTATRLYVFG